MAEDDADLVPVDIIAGRQGEVEQTAVVAEDRDDRVLLDVGPVEVEADQTVQLSQRLEVKRVEEVTVGQTEMGERRPGQDQRDEDRAGSDVTVIQAELGAALVHCPAPVLISTKLPPCPSWVGGVHVVSIREPSYI